MTSRFGSPAVFVLRSLVILVATTSGCSIAKLSNKLTPPHTEKQTARSQTKDSMESAINADRERALLLAAESRWRDDDPADCERLLDRLLENNPESRDAQRMLAELHLATGRPHLALREFQYLLNSEPNSLELQYQYAAALEETGNIHEANSMFERIANSANPESWLAATLNRPSPIGDVQLDIPGARPGPTYPNQPIFDGGVIPANHVDQRARFIR